MPQKPGVKRVWSRSRELRVVTPSRYEKNPASVKQYWKNYIAGLELSYKDDKFWESNTRTVRNIVPDITFRKLAKMYNLPLQDQPYSPRSEISSLEPSAHYYKSRTLLEKDASHKFSLSGLSSGSHRELEAVDSQESVGEASASGWSAASGTSTPYSAAKSSRMLAVASSGVGDVSVTAVTSSRASHHFAASLSDEPASSMDDVIVHAGDHLGGGKKRRSLNPHHELLRTNKSEGSMITWPSNYHRKRLEVSASDEFSKRAEITTKKIAKEFFDWYTAMGEVEFKSEIKRPEDIEQLFQVWFDEHASRGIVLDARILPCVLQPVATACGVPERSCPSALRRQVAWDIAAESTPEHTVAFNTCLPQRSKHIPPDNDTRAQWRGVRIPQDLKTMSCVWDDIKHLSSTKEFYGWLTKRPHLAMPPCLRSLGAADGKKSLFVIPSDFVMRGSDTSVEGDLALPVSQLNLELKAVLSQLMN